MTYGMQLINGAGQLMQYGTENIPSCLHAIRVNLTVNENIIDTPVPFTNDLSIFVSCEHSTGKITPYVRTTNHNGYIRLQINLIGNWDVDPIMGTYRIYLVGRVPPSTVISDYGIALWGSDGQLKFYSDFPMAPLDPIVNYPAGHYPFIGVKKAVWAMPTGTDFEGEVYNPLPAYFYSHHALWHDRRSGAVNEGCIDFYPQPFPPGGGSWGQRVAYTLISMDTTDADARFFND